jgi:hypothetical protein
VTYGETPAGPPRWLAFLTILAAVVGIVLGLWVFAALT